MHSSLPRPPDLIRRRRPHLGTLVEVAAPTAVALEAAFAAVAHVHALMSFQDPRSALSRLNAATPGDWTACHPWTAAVLQVEVSNRALATSAPAAASHLTSASVLAAAAMADALS